MWRQVWLLTGCGAGGCGEQHLKLVPLRNPKPPTLCLQSYLFIFQVLTFVVLYLFRRFCDLQSLIASVFSCIIVLVQQLSGKFSALDDLNSLPSIMFGSWVAGTSWGKSLYLDLCPLVPSLKWTNKESSRVVFISTCLQSAYNLILAFFTFFKPLIHLQHLLSQHMFLPPVSEIIMVLSEQNPMVFLPKAFLLQLQGRDCIYSKTNPNIWTLYLICSCLCEDFNYLFMSC